MTDIVLITPGQPSSNPRLVKETLALKEAGYTVTVIFSFWADWADAPDKVLFRQHPEIRWIRAGGHPREQPLLYWYTRIRHKVYRMLAGRRPTSAWWLKRAEFRCYDETKRKALQTRGDLYIAHNLGALAPAAEAARRHGTKYGFDAEDYHRGQPATGSAQAATIAVLEERYLPGTSYCTAASPLIGLAYHKDFPGVNPLVINNVFSIRHLQPAPAPYLKGQPLKLFWFSQTVGRDRGLETLIAAIGRNRDLEIEVTILGFCTPEEKERLLSLAKASQVREDRIHFHDPVPPDDLFAIAHRHHIGLAMESCKTLNSSWALANKIFTYLLAGLAIAATDTPAQKKFFLAHPDTGSLYGDGDDSALAALLQSLAGNPDTLNLYREKGRELARTEFNWEKEKLAFLDKVATVIKAAE